MCVCVEGGGWGGGRGGGGGWGEGVGVCSLANYSVAYEETQSNRVSRFRDFVRSWLPKPILYDIFYSTVAGVVPCGGRKVSPYIIIVQVLFYFLWAHYAYPGYVENRIPLKPALGGVCRLANYSVAYEETQSNRVSDFRDFVLFVSKAILFAFSYIWNIPHRANGFLCFLILCLLENDF